jgi:hypothetical protein
VLRRLEQFALSLHPDKTRLIEFARLAAENRARLGQGKPETFNFLGFTHICGRSRKGKFLLKRKTRRDRSRARLQKMKEELRRRMHLSIPEQGKWLRQVVIGYFGFHAVPTNFKRLNTFRYHVVNLLRRVLKRRSQKDRTTWERIARIASDWLPTPIHGQRHALPSNTKGGSLVRESRSLGSVRGVPRKGHSYRETINATK